MSACSNPNCNGGTVEIRMKKGKVQTFPCPTCTADASKIGRPISPKRSPR